MHPRGVCPPHCQQCRRIICPPARTQCRGRLSCRYRRVMQPSSSPSPFQAPIKDQSTKSSGYCAFASERPSPSLDSRYPCPSSEYGTAGPSGCRPPARCLHRRRRGTRLNRAPRRRVPAYCVGAGLTVMRYSPVLPSRNLPVTVAVPTARANALAFMSSSPILRGFVTASVSSRDDFERCT